MQVREPLHRLIDELPDAELGAIERLLAEGRPASPAVSDGTVHGGRGGADDDELTAADLAALEQAYADVAAGRVLPHEEARRRLLGRP